jgi:hypothetical protein
MESPPPDYPPPISKYCRVPEAAEDLRDGLRTEVKRRKTVTEQLK